MVTDQSPQDAAERHHGGRVATGDHDKMGKCDDKMNLDLHKVVPHSLAKLVYNSHNYGLWQI